MAISATKRKDDFDGNNSGNIFDFPFKVLEKNEFTLIHTDSDGVDKELVVDTDYVLEGIGSDDGIRITYPKDTEKPLLQLGEKLTGFRTTSHTQMQDFKYGGGFSPRIHENAFDKVMMILQEHEEELSRRPVFPITAEDYDIMTWTEEIESNTTKAINDSAMALSAAAAAETSATGAETVAAQAAVVADNAKVTADEALLTSRLADGNASIAVSTAEAAEAKATEAVSISSTASEDADYAVGKVAEKLERDGSNIDKLSFLQNAGFRDEDLNLDFSDFALTGGSNIDVAAHRVLLGIDEIDSDVTALTASAANTSGSNIDVSGYSSQLGLADLAGTSGSNIDVVAFKTALAPRVVTSLSGIAGNYTGEQILRVSGIAGDPDDDMYFWDGSQFRKEGV